MPTVEHALRNARPRLVDSDTPGLDAELLLCHALGRRRTWLRAWPEAVLADHQRETFDELIERRAAGEPVAYLLGRREFWSLELEVGPGVLIPRPETETLVWCVLRLLPVPIDRPLELLDLGTGSGCIALTLAHARPDLRVTGVDSSPRALDYARRNAERHGIANVTFSEGDWFTPVKDRRFDAVVSNPPYVRSGDEHLHRGDLRFEPADALEAGPDGLDAIRCIVETAPRHLVPGGLLAIEHGHDQGEAVARLLRESGFGEIAQHADDAGLPRVTVACAVG